MKNKKVFKYVEDPTAAPLPVSSRVTAWAQENNVTNPLLCSWHKIRRERATHNELYVRFNGSQDMIIEYENSAIVVVESQLEICSERSKRYSSFKYYH